MHHGHGTEISPRALHLLLLPEGFKEGNIQGAEREAILSRLL